MRHSRYRHPQGVPGTTLFEKSWLRTTNIQLQQRSYGRETTYHSGMLESNAVPEIREVSVGDRACEATKESEGHPYEVHGKPHSSHAVHKIGNQILTLSKDNIASGTASSSNIIASSSYRSSTNGTANMELFHVEPEMSTLFDDMSNEDLCSLAELHEDPVNDVQIELYIFTYFLLFTRTFSAEYLEQAIQRTEGWVAATDLHHPDRARRFQIFDMMSARMSEFTYISEEVLPALMDEG